jgi:hypothetical protein
VRFREFVDQKVLRHHANHFGKRPTVHHPPNSDCGCLTDSGESEADEDAEEDGKDTQSNCCSSEPGGAQSFDGTPWSGSRSRNMNEYAAPTAPMVSKPSSMGQTKSRLDSDNFVPNRATPQEYQRQYRTSMDDRMARGSSRSKPEPTSDSVPDILFDVNPNSPSQNPPEIPSWAQDESIRVGARGGLKRAGVCSAAPEEGEVRKKRKYVRKVPCPKLSLVVKLKLTREKSKKIIQGAHHQGPGVETSAPAPLASSEWPVGRLESYNAIPSTQECHASPFTLQSHEQENMAIPSSRVSHSHPRESDKAAETLAAVVDTSVVDTSAINVPATNSSVPNIHSAVAEDRDVRGRDGFVAALPDLENEASRQQTAVKTPNIPTAVEQAHVEQFPAQVMENSPGMGTTIILSDLDQYNSCKSRSTECFYSSHQEDRLYECRSRRINGRCRRDCENEAPRPGEDGGHEHHRTSRHHIQRQLLRQHAFRAWRQYRRRRHNPASQGEASLGSANRRAEDRVYYSSGEQEKYQLGDLA